MREAEAKKRASAQAQAQSGQVRQSDPQMAGRQQGYQGQVGAPVGMGALNR